MLRLLQFGWHAKRAEDLWNEHNLRPSNKGKKALGHALKAYDRIRHLQENERLTHKKNILEMLAALYADVATIGRSEGIEISISLYQQLLDNTDLFEETSDWLNHSRNIALTLRKRRSGYEDTNIEWAISYLEEALALADPLRFPNERAKILETLSDAYRDRPRGSSQENHNLETGSLRQSLTLSDETVRRHIKRHRFRPGPRETLLTLLFDIRRRICGIATVLVR